MTKKKEVVTKNEELPAHLQNMSAEGRGSEDVNHDDLIIPRVEQAQGLSPCLKKKDPSYIEGIELGDLYNNVTRENYGQSIEIVPVVFKKEWLIWKDQDEGGGFFGAFETEKLAQEALSLIEDENHDFLEIVDTAQHFCLIIHEDGRREEVVFSMNKSKMKASRQLNSLVRINGGDRFSRRYYVANKDDTNKKGQEYQTVVISNIGYVDEDTYKHGEKLYDSVRSGAVQADRTEDIDDPEREVDNEKAF